jgi:hypothetical protein
MVNSRFISLAEVREHATNIVVEFGADYLYPRSDPALGAACHYVRDNKPSCLVGQILFRCGMSLEWMHSWENCGPGHLFDGDDERGITWVAESEDVLNALHMMQRLQDSGSTWGECLAVIEDE